MKDALRNRVYKAEALFREDPSVSDEKIDLDAAQALVERWHKALNPDHHLARILPEVRAGKVSQRYSFYNRGARNNGQPLIVLHPSWGFCGLILAHEFTHHLVVNTLVQAHGPEFMRGHHGLLHLTHGGRVAERYAWHLDAAKLKWRVEDQAKAAKKQLVRLRSDYRRHSFWGDRPVAQVTWEDPVTGGYYRTLTQFELEGDKVSFLNGTTVDAADLRYVQGDMVRFR